MESPSATLRRYGLRAKKSWGQCFLKEPSIVDKIVDAANPTSEDTVVEIGAGLGGLTLALAKRAGTVYAIERDRDLVTVLRQVLVGTSVQILEANALTFDFNTFAAPVKVIGNLPYNISSPLLFRLLEQGRGIRDATIMLQREVAERLVAAPGTRRYGVPSVLCQQRAEVRLCFHVSRAAFHPEPAVDSAVVQLVMRSTPLVDVATEPFEALVRAAFSARRKTLKNALGQVYRPEAVQAALEAAGLDGGRRGETLTLQEFGLLATLMEQTTE